MSRSKSALQSFPSSYCSKAARSDSLNERRRPQRITERPTAANLIPPNATTLRTNHRRSSTTPNALNNNASPSVNPGSMKPRPRRNQIRKQPHRLERQATSPATQRRQHCPRWSMQRSPSVRKSVQSRPCHQMLCRSSSLRRRTSRQPTWTCSQSMSIQPQPLMVLLDLGHRTRTVSLTKWLRRPQQRHRL